MLFFQVIILLIKAALPVYSVRVTCIFINEWWPEAWVNEFESVKHGVTQRELDLKIA